MDTTKDAFEDGILDHHLSLKQSIAAILQLAQNGSPISPATLLPLAQKAQETVGSTQKLLSNNLSTNVYNRRTTASSSAISEKTFAVPELLELILERVAHYMTLEQLLEVRLVCRPFDQSVMGSVKLQRILGLAPFDDQYFRAPLELQIDSTVPTYWGITIETNYSPNWYRTPMPINLVELSVHFNQITLSASSVWGRMSICQPPLREIDCTDEGCGTKSVVTAKDGGFITVRDLHEAVQSIYRDQRGCCLLDEISFSKSFSLHANDPLIAKRRQSGLEDDLIRKKDRWTTAFDEKYPGYLIARNAGKWQHVLNGRELH